MARLYYWHSRPNAGDYFSYWLAKKLYKTVVADSLSPNLIITGSILDHKMLNNDTIVWGSGWHNKNLNATCKITNKNNFKAVRGKLTAEKFGLDNIALGDPGLLASEFYTPKVCTNKKDYCLICHMLDYKQINAAYGKLIDVIPIATNDIEQLFDKINQYKLVLSTSLHGIIFAHSFGIPAVHVELNNVGSRDNFKFKDYYSVLDIPYLNYNLTLDKDKDFSKFKKYLANSNKYLPSKQTILDIQNSLLKVRPSERDLHPNYNTVVCAIAKNENRYINDWVNYYIGLGIDHIYLFDNNDKSTEYVGNYIDKIDKVTVINVNNIHEQSFQLTCYNNFYERYNRQFKWAMFIDIDEFLTGVSDINAFLAQSKFAQYEMIRIKWKIFGDDNKLSRDLSIPVYKAIQKEIVDHKFSNNGKCIVRGGLVGVNVGSCHFAFRGTRCEGMKAEGPDLKPLVGCLPSGKPCNSRIAITEDYSAETVFLNHYMTKTLTEFISQKLGRGDAVFAKRQTTFDYYWKVNEKTEEKLKFIEQFLINGGTQVDEK